MVGVGSSVRGELAFLRVRRSKMEQEGFSLNLVSFGKIYQEGLLLDRFSFSHS